MQVQRLEAVLGEQLLHRGRGGSVELTRHGQFLLQHARDMLALNDDIWRTFHSPAVAGTVCLGTPDDYALALPAERAEALCRGLSECRGRSRLRAVG